MAINVRNRRFLKELSAPALIFEAAARGQRAHVTRLEPSGSRIGHEESMKHTARVLGRSYDGIEYHGFEPRSEADRRRWPCAS